MVLSSLNCEEVTYKNRGKTMQRKSSIIELMVGIKLMKLFSPPAVQINPIGLSVNARPQCSMSDFKVELMV